MYNPHAFRKDDREELVAFMRVNSFATLVSVVDGAPVVSHIPLVISETNGEIFIIGHVAKANPHRDAFDGRAALAIFLGPHAYVSPSLYDKIESVPTWNYVAVHASGVPEPIAAGENSAQVEAMLTEMIAAFDPTYQAQWDGLDTRFREGMLRGVVGFRMHVTSLEGKYKLSQNRSDADRARVAHTLLASHDTIEQGVGEAMQATLTSRQPT
jgi:transcriptional regulator